MDIYFMLHTVLICCQGCSRSVQRHAKQVKCSSCCLILHLTCVSLSVDEQNFIMNDVSSWMCPSCIQTIFPFNWIEEDEIFSKEVCGWMNCVEINDLFIDENKIFHVFDVFDDNEDHLVDDIDPDKNDCNRYDFKLAKNSSTMMKIDSMGSMLKSKIKKSINKVANPFQCVTSTLEVLLKNVSSFSDYLSNFDHYFTFIGIS